MYACLLVDRVFDDMEPEEAFSLMVEDETRDMFALVTEQMSAKAGLKHFGDKGPAAIMKELEQLVYMKVMEGRRNLTRKQKLAALKYLMFLKEKRSGRIKGRGCTDGRKQRLYDDLLNEQFLLCTVPRLRDSFGSAHLRADGACLCEESLTKYRPPKGKEPELFYPPIQNRDINFQIDSISFCIYVLSFGLEANLHDTNLLGAFALRCTPLMDVTVPGAVGCGSTSLAGD